MLGKIANVFNVARLVPIYEQYNGKTMSRIKQDVYDRFFTRVEQRFGRKDITSLRKTFKDIIISESIPYWHFLCKRESSNNESNGI